MEDINILREVITVLSFLAFAAIVIYAYTPKNRERFEEAARVPLDDEPSPRPSPKGEGAKA
jgi:cytochrome c oxidase cbb3-type subunit 4